MKALIATLFLLLTLPPPASAVPVERPVDPATLNARRTLYCSGTRLSFAYSRVEALCIDAARAKAYTLSVAGLGASYQVAGTIFRITVAYDGTRYDPNFDPVPGQYFVMITGLQVGPGFATMAGSAGNKQVLGRAYNFGLGVDYTLAALMIIQ